MPNNDRVYRKYVDQGVVLLGVTADDEKANYDGWVKRNSSKYQFTMTFDPAGRKGWGESVFNTGYHVTGFPTMFVIGRDGRIAEIVSGGGPGEDYRLEYALARAGVKVDLASLPPEKKRDPNAPKSIPMMGKTPAMRTTKMIGMGGAAGGDPRKFGSLEGNAEVPDFTVTGADGKPVRLSDFKGKTVIVNFFSSAARGPETYAAEAAAKYAGQDVVMFAVASAMDQSAYQAWHAAAKPAYASGWDTAGKAWSENVTNLDFGVGMYPAIVVVNKAGRLAGGYIGLGPKNLDRLHTLLLFAGVELAKEDLPKMAMPAARITPHAPEPGGMTPAERIPTLAAGAVAPDFTSYTVDGKPVKLADYAGQVVILDFWATWCGPCMASMPHTQELAKTYKDQGVVVVASCTSDTRAKFEEWVKKNQAKYPDMLFTTDPNERGSATFNDRASAKLYHVVGIPTQFIIGRDGKIVGTLVGYDKGDERAAAVLARAGIKVDPALVTEGEKQLQRDAADAIKEAAAAKAAKLHPKPPFYERFGKIKAGETVPDFTVQTADGQSVQFSSLAKGKTVIFDFWATWCGPCQMAMPHLEETYQNYKDQNVLVIGLCCFDTREAYDSWLKKNAGKYTFPTVFDPTGRPKLPSPDDMEKMAPEAKAAAKAMTKKYYADLIPTGVFGAFPMLPTTIVIDHEGRLVGSYSGYREGKNEALGNLLLRAGVKLTAADRPDRVWTTAETKEAPPEAKVTTLQAGADAPDFAATDVNGKAVRISDCKGKVVVLDFWATWCGPCMASMPHTQEVAAHYADQGVVVLASCTSDTRAKFEEWVRKNQSVYPNLHFSHDPAERTPARASHKLYGVQGIPTQFIIGRDGKIAAVVVGYMKGEALLEAGLAKAGVKVDAATLQKAKLDQAKRDDMAGITRPATPLKKPAPARA
jgi:peroxiredoxin